MARESQSTKGKSKDVPSDVDDDNNKPSPPPKRPGTSGTEHLLVANRRQASEQFVKAQRAEKMYRAKKQASLARASYNETKHHFREGLGHFRHGARGLVSVVKAVPYLVDEKREQRRVQAETDQRRRHLEKKKRLEEALARQQTAESDTTNGDAADKADKAEA